MTESPEQAERNREAWLTSFVSLALPVIRERTGLNLHHPVKISCGFPATGGRIRKRKDGGTSFTAGECFVLPPTTERRYHQIFVHPSLVKPLDVGGTILHELLHAMLPHGTGHRKPFSQAAKKLGLEGKPTHATAKEDTALAKLVEEMVAALGDYPHEALHPEGGPKQSTRLIKVMCPMCGYVGRVTYKWIDEAGCPICPQCLISMEEAGVDAEAAMPLIAVEQSVEYKVKAIKRHALDRARFDPRWSIRMNRKGNVIRWWVIDYGPSEDDQGMAILGTVQPLLTIAESREDAISLLEALRDGSMTYDDIEERDHREPEDEEPDLGDPGDWTDDEEYLDEDEDESPDSPESDIDPRFQWEKDRGIPVDDIDPDAEREKRERWAIKE